jgi:hypothetical protein
MKRLVLLLIVLGFAVSLDAQKRPRWGRDPLAGVNLAPTLQIQSPSADGTFQTNATTVQLTGAASDDHGVALVEWENQTTAVSGTAVLGGSALNATWDSGASSEGAQTANDSFTVGTNVASLAARVANSGQTWASFTSVGTKTLTVYAGTGSVGPNNGADSEFTAVHLPATLATPDYTIKVTTNYTTAGIPDSTDALGVFFRATDAQNVCGVEWLGDTAATDLKIFKYQASATATLLASATNVNIINAQTIEVDVEPGGIITVKRAGVTLLTHTDTFCDEVYTGAGVFAGSMMKVAGNDMATQGRLDDFEIVYNGATGGIALNSGLNTIRVRAKDDDASPLYSDWVTIAVTRGVADTEAPVTVISQPTANPEQTTSTALIDPSGTWTDNVAVTSGVCNCATCTPTSRAMVIGAGTWTLVGTLLQANGLNTISCTTTDAAANTSVADVLSSTLSNPGDSTPPVLTITTDGGSGVGANFSTATTPVSLTGTCVDNTQSSERNVQWTNAQGSAGTATGTANWTASIALATGANAISVTCQDEAGNTSTADTITVTLTAATLSIVTNSMLPAVQNVAYDQPVIANNGTTPYVSFLNHATGLTSLGAGACTGLSIGITGSPAQGRVTGTPTTTGTCNFTARVTDTAAGTATKALSITVNATPTGNSYFDSLLLRGDYYKSVTYRSASQFLSRSQGGLADSNNAVVGYYWSYDSAMDAGKVTIPAFDCGYNGLQRHLGAGIDADDPSITITAEPANSSTITTNRDLMIDNEIMHVTGWNDLAFRNIPNVARGSFGTTPADHTTTPFVCLSNNSTRNTLEWFGGSGGSTGTIGTQDGFTYVFTIDVRLDSSYVNSGLTNYKFLTFRDENSKLFEVNSNWVSGNGSTACNWTGGATFVAFVARTYNPLGGPADWAQSTGWQAGPGITRQDPLGMSNASVFCSTGPNKWIRIWIRVEQRANDYDYFDMWVADESQAAVRVYTQAPMSIFPGTTGSLRVFDLEWGTSTEGHRRGASANPLRDFIGYAKNLVVLRAAGLAADGSLSDADLVSSGVLTQP